MRDYENALAGEQALSLSLYVFLFFPHTRVFFRVLVTRDYSRVFQIRELARKLEILRDPQGEYGIGYVLKKTTY